MLFRLGQGIVRSLKGCPGHKRENSGDYHCMIVAQEGVDPGQMPLTFEDRAGIERTMKEGIHPDYREVVFQDMAADFAFLSRSTVQTKETIVWEDGKEYPLVKVEISSKSHPFYTGKQKIVDTAGRVDRFRRKYGMS